jgi:flagellar biogenesis protein FliO
MVPFEKRLRAKSVLPTWLIFCVLGLTATLCGLFLPQSLRGRREPALAVPPSEPAHEKKDPLEYSPPALPDLPTPGSMFLRLGLGTTFVLILCATTLWAGKRWVRPLTAPLGENRKLRVLESLPLAGRCSIFLLQAGETKVLVGVDHGGIKALLPLPQPFDGALAELDNQFTTERTEKTEERQKE